MALNFLFMGPFSVGVPVLANKRLAEEAAAYGLIMSAFGGGSLAGIVLAGTLPRPKPAYFGTLMLSITALLGIGLILLPLTVSTPVITLISLVMGIMDGYIFISMMTWLQKRIPGELMGRVMSLIMLASVGLAPVSSTLAGAVLDINLVGLFVAAGILMTSLALFFAATPIARQIGLETAASSDAPRSG
jgi:MFS family permease